MEKKHQETKAHYHYHAPRPLNPPGAKRTTAPAESPRIAVRQGLILPHPCPASRTHTHTSPSLQPIASLPHPCPPTPHPMVPSPHPTLKVSAGARPVSRPPPKFPYPPLLSFAVRRNLTTISPSSIIRTPANARSAPFAPAQQRRQPAFGPSDLSHLRIEPCDGEEKAFG